MEEYINFFEENFGDKAPELATRWNNRMLVEEEKVKEAEAEAESELPGEDQPDETVQPEDESPAKEIKSVRRKEAEEEKKEEVEKPVELVAPKDTVIPEISVRILLPMFRQLKLLSIRFPYSRLFPILLRLFLLRILSLPCRHRKNGKSLH